MDDTQLKRSLTLKDTIILSIGNIIGAGVFILLGTIIRYGGKKILPIFVLAMIFNICAALCYAELGTMYQSNGVEFEAIKDSFGNNIAIISLIALVGFLVSTIGTLALMFAEYTTDNPRHKMWIAFLLIAILSIIDYLGIEGSKMITNGLGGLKLGALVILIVIGILHIKWKSIILAGDRIPFDKLVYTSFLAIFLFNGYDAIVKMTDEIKDPQKTIPIALMSSIGITSFIYICIALIVIGTGVASKKPINELFQYFIDTHFTKIIIYALGLLTIFNTTFISILALSRFLYGIAKTNKQWDTFGFADINSQFHTPHKCVLLVFCITALFLLVGRFESAAVWTNTFLIIYILLLMLAVLVLRFKKPDDERPFRIPLSAYNIPIPVIVGLGIVFFYLTQIPNIHKWSHT